MRAEEVRVQRRLGARRPARSARQGRSARAAAARARLAVAQPRPHARRATRATSRSTRGRAARIDRRGRPRELGRGVRRDLGEREQADEVRDVAVLRARTRSLGRSHSRTSPRSDTAGRAAPRCARRAPATHGRGSSPSSARRGAARRGELAQQRDVHRRRRRDPPHLAVLVERSGSRERSTGSVHARVVVAADPRQREPRGRLQHGPRLVAEVVERRRRTRSGPTGAARATRRPSTSWPTRGRRGLRRRARRTPRHPNCGARPSRRRRRARARRSAPSSRRGAGRIASSGSWHSASFVVSAGQYAICVLMLIVYALDHGPGSSAFHSPCRVIGQPARLRRARSAGTGRSGTSSAARPSSGRSCARQHPLLGVELGASSGEGARAGSARTARRGPRRAPRAGASASAAASPADGMLSSSAAASASGIAAGVGQARERGRRGRRDGQEVDGAGRRREDAGIGDLRRGRAAHDDRAMAPGALVVADGLGRMLVAGRDVDGQPPLGHEVAVALGAGPPRGRRRDPISAAQRARALDAVTSCVTAPVTRSAHVRCRTSPPPTRYSWVAMPVGEVEASADEPEPGSPATARAVGRRAPRGRASRAADTPAPTAPACRISSFSAVSMSLARDRGAHAARASRAAILDAVERIGVRRCPDHAVDVVEPETLAAERPAHIAPRTPLPTG